MMTTHYFSTGDTDLVGLFGRLGTGGIVRIGGNSVDQTQWNHTGAGQTAPPASAGHVSPP